MGIEFTKGPWAVETMPSRRLTVTAGQFFVAGNDCDYGLLPENARLIAAAPGLYGALDRLVARLDSEPEDASFLIDSGCIECTVGTVPNDLNTGLCPLHAAKAVLREAA